MAMHCFGGVTSALYNYMVYEKLVNGNFLNIMGAFHSTESFGLNFQQLPVANGKALNFQKFP